MGEELADVFEKNDKKNKTTSVYRLSEKPLLGKFINMRTQLLIYKILRVEEEIRMSFWFKMKEITI